MVIRESYLVKICVISAVMLAAAVQGNYVKRITPDPKVPRLYLKPNEPLHLEYEASGDSELTFDTRPFGEGSSGFRAYWDSGVYKVKLSIKVSIADSGQYICKLKDNSARDTLEILVVNITGKNDVLKEEYEDVTVGCSVGNVNGYSMEWYRKGVKLVEGGGSAGGAAGHGDTGPVYNISKADKTLTISQASRKDIGQYDCVVFPEADNYPLRNITGSAFVESIPYIDHFERSKNLVQGDTVKIDCKAYGYPVPKITWYKITNEEEGTEKAISGVENRTIISASNGVPNSRLEISDLVMEDGGRYGCRAVNDFNQTSADVLVRVKDKYAALWPFLGIVVEVVILCVIIFIYEKKRGKRHEEDDSPDVQKSNSHDHKADDLRQRNKNKA